MTRLYHSKVDLLKFDIEGFEWEFFDSFINQTNPDKLPDELAFELHTQGANANFVPPENVAGRTYSAVNRLFLDLYKADYLVTSKEINRGDHYCCEFVLLRVGSLQHHRRQQETEETSVRW
mmetsp:Transcript_2398/g.3214  ORF Transcript_2398/g.3214 Transcript_2398/m.3214 type:complete len:121 (-) Transcript_2398:377-739(-)